MKLFAFKYLLSNYFLRGLTALFLAASPVLAQATTPITVTDMAGRQVSIAQPVQRIATVGSVPVINSVLFALGAGDKLINGLPPFARRPRWALQYVFAPHIRTLPDMQNPDHSPRLEALLHAQPDVVLTMSRQTADLVQETGLSAVYLAWRNPQEVKRSVTLLATLLARPDHAARFARHFDDTLAWVNQQLQRHQPVPPRVLYLRPDTLTQPHAVAEWWIAAAGGRSVTADDRQTESRTFTLEQLLAWDPDVLIVSSYQDAQVLRAEPRFATLTAVRNQRVAIAPTGAHTWGNRTAEQALTVLWAATHFHPHLFSRDQLRRRTHAFYRDIYGVDLSSQQVDDLLAGRFEHQSTP